MSSDENVPFVPLLLAARRLWAFADGWNGTGEGWRWFSESGTATSVPGPGLRDGRDEAIQEMMAQHGDTGLSKWEGPHKDTFVKDISDDVVDENRLAPTFYNSANLMAEAWAWALNGQNAQLLADAKESGHDDVPEIGTIRVDNPPSGPDFEPTGTLWTPAESNEE